MGVELKVLLINLGSNSPWDVKVICHYPPKNYTSKKRVREASGFIR